ncbi:terminase [Aeromicrobium piscarium]|uniref:Terminase n=1 Tax=Aeromicrobium piscarium TaxID=2590901 RepID=A0A554SP34_9ACTN|nr:terminase [Aeromicrobium piscarium]TSD68122.1 terminase [Aeromicrobium piscarium]
MEWLPEPDAGTPICLGFDGSDVSDWTVLSAETCDGFSFTPRYGPDRRPTIWIPDEWGGTVPRKQVSIAVDEIHDRFEVARGYYDTPRWETDVDIWAGKHGEECVIAWPTYRVKPMHEALERFYTDLSTGRIRHDGCPLTNLAMANARKIAKSSDRYILGKPSQHQKIDPAMTRVLAHEAAADARAAGWGDEEDDGPSIFFLP